MVLNEYGNIVKTRWNIIPEHFPHVYLNEYIIMPNHMHGIIVIVADHRVCPNGLNNKILKDEHMKSSPKNQNGEIKGQSQGIVPTEGGLSLGNVVQRFKSLTTNRYIEGIKQNGWSSFNKKLWQRNYYEHIIRNEKDLTRIREYIVNNPLKWPEDKYFIQMKKD